MFYFWLKLQPSFTTTQFSLSHFSPLFFSQNEFGVKLRKNPVVSKSITQYYKKKTQLASGQKSKIKTSVMLG